MSDDATDLGLSANMTWPEIMKKMDGLRTDFIRSQAVAHRDEKIEAVLSAARKVCLADGPVIDCRNLRREIAKMELALRELDRSR